MVGITLIWSGIDVATTPGDVTEAGLRILRVAMLGLPMAMIVVSYLILRAKYRLDEEFYGTVVADLAERSARVDEAHH